MDQKTIRVTYFMAILENIGLIVLSGILCLHFNSLWGLLSLIFSNTLKSKDNKSEEDQIDDNSGKINSIS